MLSLNKHITTMVTISSRCPKLHAYPVHPPDIHRKASKWFGDVYVIANPQDIYKQLFSSGTHTSFPHKRQSLFFPSPCT